MPPVVKLLERHPHARMFRLADVAREFSVSVSSLRRWADEGKVKTVRTLANQRRVTREAVEALATQVAVQR